MPPIEIGKPPFEIGSFSATLAVLFAKGVRYSTVIDVGCADGSFFLTHRHYGIFSGAKPLNIDANSIYEGSLRAIKDCVGGHYVIGAASDTAGQAEMTLGAHPYWSSLRGQDDRYWNQIHNLSNGTSKVPTFTIDGLAEQFGLKPPFLLKLDVQGAEAQVLRGARRILAQTDMAICEANMDDFQSLHGLLVEAGLELFDITQLGRTDDHTLGWFYPVYVSRRLGSIKPSTLWAARHSDQIIQRQAQRRAQLLELNAQILAEMRKLDERIIAGESFDLDPRTSLIQADAMILRLSNGVALAVPSSLQVPTTYVLLEQETWFERELAFLPHLLRPGMTAIDIGANLGIYSLTMARLVAPGRVFAYEPASEPRALLKRSRELNQASNLEICAAALSDGRREGHLAFGASSELNKLADSGAGERVEITSLDLEAAERGWPAPDFVKIDAEGEEERVLAGGADFFSRHSPLVMFEIMAGRTINERLMSTFPSMGYRLYQMLPTTPVLIPLGLEGAPTTIELNLFAAKSDRALALAQAGLLVEALPDWQPDEQVRSEFLALWNAQAFAPVLAPMLGDLAALDPDYRDALGAYAFWRMVDNPLPDRCAALFYAFRVLCALCERAGTAARLSTLARVAWEAGARVACAQALDTLVGDLQPDWIENCEPFWPACPRFDTVAANGRARAWFVTSVVEQSERIRGFSSFFAGASPVFEWLCEQPLASIEMQRRRVLLAARAGRHIVVPPRLCTAAPDHLNADIWRTGQVPGTSLGARTNQR